MVLLKDIKIGTEYWYAFSKNFKISPVRVEIVHQQCSYIVAVMHAGDEDISCVVDHNYLFTDMIEAEIFSLVKTRRSFERLVASNIACHGETMTFINDKFAEFVNVSPDLLLKFLMAEYD